MSDQKKFKVSENRGKIVLLKQITSLRMNSEDKVMVMNNNCDVKISRITDKENAKEFVWDQIEQSSSFKDEWKNIF